MDTSRPRSVRLIYNAAASFLLLSAVSIPVWSAHGQTTTYAGAVDSHFTPPAGLAGNLDDDFNPAGSIQATALQPDGKLIVVGSQIRGIVRLNADGTKDTTFNVGQGTDGAVSAVVQQADGSLLIGGEFTTVNGAPTPYLTHVMKDGTIDTTYNPVLNGAVRAMTILTNGKVAVGGEFTAVNGSTPASHLTSIDNAGNADPTFSSVGTDGPVYSIAEHPDGSGRLLVGGSFNNIGGKQTANLGQVMPTGEADQTFDPGTLSTGAHGVDGTVQVVKFVKDGSGNALVGGSFASVGPVTSPALVRVTPQGIADASFLPGRTTVAQIARKGESITAGGISNGSKTPTVYSLDIQSDGKVVIGGAFAKIANSVLGSFARLTTDGSVDPVFATGNGANSSVRSVLLQKDDKPIIAGSFNQVNGASLGGIARLTADTGAPAFFDGGVAVGGGFYYLAFPGGTPFGYFNFVGNGYSFPYFYHADLGLEYFFDAGDGQSGAYLYDFKSSSFFYTSPNFPFPYLYDFSLNAVLYYYSDPNNAGHYNTNGVRYFYDFASGKIISK